MGRVVFTGTGVVSPIGTGNEQFWKAVINDKSGLGRIKKIPSQSDFIGGEIGDFDFDRYINDRKFRRASEISKYALVAAKIAAGDAVNTERTALIMGITHGALNYTQEFHRSIVKDGAASPILFSDSVLNAPAGNVSIYFGIKGPVHTIVGGPNVAIKSIMLGSKMLVNGSADKVIVISAEEINELSFSYYSRKGIGILSEGAGAIVIEKEDSVKELPYCYISGISSRYNPSDSDSLKKVIDNALEAAALKLSDISLILTDSSINDMTTGSIISLTGNAFAVTTMWHIILSCLAFKNGELPMTVIRNKAAVLNSAGNVLVCSLDKNVEASAIVLSGYE